jgi:hypothetical protein
MNGPSDRASAQCECTVRPPVHGDYDRMAHLAGQLGYPPTVDQVRARLSEIQDSNERAIYVAELSDGQIAGGSESTFSEASKWTSSRKLTG